MGCVESLKYEILLKHCSFKEASEWIKANCAESFEVRPGTKVFDVYVIGVPPILIGINGTQICFPYTKPCHGTFLLRVEDGNEAERIRRMASAKKR
jgi:hypothetical protein